MTKSLTNLNWDDLRALLNALPLEALRTPIRISGEPTDAPAEMQKRYQGEADEITTLLDEGRPIGLVLSYLGRPNVTPSVTDQPQHEPVGIAYSHAVPQPGMAPKHWKSDGERFAAAWHAAHCRLENCELCDTLCDEGLVIACDECGRVHHTDWLGWHGTEPDASGRVTVHCPECAQ